MNDKEIERWLENHDITKGYIRQKLGIDESKVINKIEIDNDLIKEIAKDIKTESLLEKHGWELIK